MTVLLYGHYHCEHCGSHLREQSVPMDPPDPQSRVFWCENKACPNFKRSFVAPAAKVDLEEVRLEAIH